jgi:hypothetical protein
MPATAAASTAVPEAFGRSASHPEMRVMDPSWAKRSPRARMACTEPQIRSSKALRKWPTSASRTLPATKVPARYAR